MLMSGNENNSHFVYLYIEVVYLSFGESSMIKKSIWFL